MNTYQNINPNIAAYVPYGGSYHYNYDHHVYIIRDVQGAIMGTFSLENGAYRDGLPSWLDPQNAATVAAQPEPQPEPQPEIDIFDAVLGPEPVIAMIDSPEPDTELLADPGNAEPLGSDEPDGPMSYEEPELPPVSDGERIFTMMIDAAEAGTLKAFSFETSAGVTGGWRK